MKKKIYSLLLLLAVAVTGYAADAKWCLVVESAGGETIAIAADQKPVIKTVADGYELRYGENVTSFAWNELKKVTLQETEPTAIDAQQVNSETKPSFSMAPGEISILGAEPGSMAQVFSLRGQLVQNVRVDGNGAVTLSTTGLSTGVYIIKTNKSTFKFVKK